MNEAEYYEGRLEDVYVRLENASNLIEELTENEENIQSDIERYG